MYVTHVRHLRHARALEKAKTAMDYTRMSKENNTHQKRRMKWT